MDNKSSIWTKVKQRAPVTSSNVSNENETTETSNQTIVEKHDNKKHFLWYHIKKKMEFEQTVKRLLPSNTKLLLVTNLVHVSISRTKLSLNTNMMQFIPEHARKQNAMIITLVKQNDKFPKGLKTTMADTLNHTY